MGNQNHPAVDTKTMSSVIAPSPTVQLKRNHAEAYPLIQQNLLQPPALTTMIPDIKIDPSTPSEKLCSRCYSSRKSQKTKYTDYRERDDILEKARKSVCPAGYANYSNAPV